MPAAFRKLSIVCVLFIVPALVAGCDSLTSIKNYFSEPEKEPAVQTAGTPSSAPGLTAPLPKEGPGTMAPDTLARVGNWSISTEEFNDRLIALKEVVPEYDLNNTEARRLVLDELINQQVLVDGATRSGLARQKDIEAAVDEFRRTLIVREVARQLTENISVSEGEARDFYETNKDAMVGPAQWRVREIVASTQAEANRLLAEILNGSDFAETARLNSIGETAADGGDLGFITQEPFPQMGSALLSLEEGGVSGVFKGPLGFYIVKLEEKKEGEAVAFEEIKDEIIQSQTLFKQQEAILEHLERIKANADIQINEQLL